MIYVVSIDPGETCGVALWEVTGELFWKRKMSLEELIEWCATFDSGVSIVVCEDFTLRRSRANAQTGSKMAASQGIGVARAFARRKTARFVRQQPDILRIAAMHAGVALPQGHIADDVSAYLHGFFWFEKEGILKPVLQRR